MKFLPRWIASVLTIGVFLALSLCAGMMSGPVGVGMDHEASFSASIQCVDGQCSPSEMPCAAQCLQRLDQAQQRVIAEIVSSVAATVLVVGFVVRHYTHEPVSAFSAPPWQSHRLFAFRE